MDIKRQRDLQLLIALEQDCHATQRSLATRLGVALGLTNLYLKRLARKGYIKITTIPSHRIKYLLTPTGFSEKARLTYRYLDYSLSHYRDMRLRLRKSLSRLQIRGGTRVVIFGTTDVAEMAYLTVREMGLTFVGFVGNAETQTFLGYQVSSIDVLNQWNFDLLLLTDFDQQVEQMDLVRQSKVPDEKVCVLGLLA